MNLINIKVTGSDDSLKRFIGFLTKAGVSVVVGVRLRSTEGRIEVHYVLKADLSSISKVFCKWFASAADLITITGDKDSVDMPQMDEIVFSSSDSLQVIQEKIEALVDRQKHYDASSRKKFRTWKAREEW